MTALRELFRYRELLWVWSGREVKVRYSQSVLGAAWAILQPLALMLVFSVVFSLFLRVPTGDIPYPVFSYTALLPWTLFSGALSQAIPALVSNMNLVTKIYFPREILPLASIGAALVDFAVAGVVFIGLLVFYQVRVGWTVLLVPLILLIQLMLMLGVALPLAAVNVFYRDVRFVIPLLLQVWLYATPVIYPLELVPEGWRWVLALNPMVGIIEAYRAVVLRGLLPDWGLLGLSAAVSLALMLGGYALFKRLEPQFADVI